jgi:hypothetical protein
MLLLVPVVLLLPMALIRDYLHQPLPFGQLAAAVVETMLPLERLLEVVVVVLVEEVLKVLLVD